MDQCSSARHPTSRWLLTGRRGHALALGFGTLAASGAHPPAARRAVSVFDRSRANRPYPPRAASGCSGAAAWTRIRASTTTAPRGRTMTGLQSISAIAG